MIRLLLLLLGMLSAQRHGPAGDAPGTGPMIRMAGRSQAPAMRAPNGSGRHRRLAQRSRGAAALADIRPAASAGRAARAAAARAAAGSRSGSSGPPP